MALIPQTIPFLIGNGTPDGTVATVTVTAPTATLTASLPVARVEPTVTTIKRGDTAPPITLTCSLDGQPVDLGPATLRLVGRRGAGLVIDRTVTGTQDGQVLIEWEPGDTAVAGALRLEIEATWPDGTIQTFPSSRYVTVTIERDLNPPTGA